MNMILTKGLTAIGLDNFKQECQNWIKDNWKPVGQVHVSDVYPGKVEGAEDRYDQTFEKRESLY